MEGDFIVLMCVYVTIWQSDWSTASPFAACHESQLLLAEVPFALVNYWGAGISNRMKLHTQLPLPPAGWFTSSFALAQFLPLGLQFKEHQEILEVGGRGSRRFLHGTDSVHRGTDLLVFDGGQGGPDFCQVSCFRFHKNMYGNGIQ